MKRIVIIFLLLCAMSASAQEFIGYRTDSGWAETPMLRKTFRLDGVLDSRVVVIVSSLGYHELYINQTKVGDYVMQPAVSQLDKRALAIFYEVTPYIHEGDNEIMLWLGQGWGRVYGTPAVAQVWISRFDKDDLPGSDCLTTDSTWEVSPSGYSYTDNWQPMHFGGERYDARVQPDWRPASVYKADDIKVSIQQFEGNYIVDTLLPISETPQPDGSLLLDFGRVATGWFQASFPPLPAGHEITMEYLDHVDAKPPFTETDIYISSGDSGHFTNRFHMHAFRYVRIRGLNAAANSSPKLGRGMPVAFRAEPRAQVGRRSVYIPVPPPPFHHPPIFLYTYIIVIPQLYCIYTNISV
jgi:alpha-L-rhamnosidase